MVSALEQSTKEDNPRATRRESDLDKMTQQMQDLFKFKHFYDDFNLQQRLTIIKSIIELRDPSDNLGLVENWSRIVVFHDNERHDLSSTHNRPFHVTANVKGVELKRAIIDPGSSLNIVSLTILDAIGIPWE